MPDNSITLVGNLTRSAELRFTPSGTATASFGIAVNARKKNASGEYEDDPKFFNCVAWGSVAENISECLDRGARVVLTGRLDFQQWETPDGDKRSKVEVVVDEIGPSLRWATATITKNERRGSSTTGISNVQRNEPQYTDGEEPF